jgi:GxxExxY protein
VREEDLNALSHAIIGSAFKVSNALGAGFLEKVYENAMAHEMRKRGLFVQQQEPIPVFYDNALVGQFAADLIVEQTVIVEIKAANEHNEVFFAQCLNYLKATGLPLCLLLNFGKPEVAVSRLRSPTS